MQEALWVLPQSPPASVTFLGRWQKQVTQTLTLSLLPPSHTPHFPQQTRCPRLGLSRVAGRDAAAPGPEVSPTAEGTQGTGRHTFWGCRLILRRSGVQNWNSVCLWHVSFYTKASLPPLALWFKHLYKFLFKQ